MTQPKLAIVILNWNGLQFLERFLPGVMAYCPHYAQVYVADNGSSDSSMDFLVQNFPEVKRIALDQNYGFAGGYNKALKQIDAQYYVLLNSDIEVRCEWITPVLKLMDQDPEIAACQPKILSWHQPDHFEYAGAGGGFIDWLGYPFCRGRIFNHLEADRGQYDDVKEVFWASGACLFVRAADYWAAGGLDDEFFAHMEEIDLCWRLKRLDKKIYYHGGCAVYHVGGGTLPKANPRKTYLNFRNSIWMLAKNTPPQRFYAMLGLRLILDMVAAITFLLQGHWGDCKAVLKAQKALGYIKRKRSADSLIPQRRVSMIYQKSILWAYFYRKLRGFGQLSPKHFSKAN